MCQLLMMPHLLVVLGRKKSVQEPGTDCAMKEEISEYERTRNKNIEENKAILRQLGLLSSPQEPKRQRVSNPNPSPKPPRRQSARLQAQIATGTSAENAADNLGDESDEEDDGCSDVSVGSGDESEYGDSSDDKDESDRESVVDEERLPSSSVEPILATSDDEGEGDDDGASVNPRDSPIADEVAFQLVCALDVYGTDLDRPVLKDYVKRTAQNRFRVKMGEHRLGVYRNSFVAFAAAEFARKNVPTKLVKPTDVPGIVDREYNAILRSLWHSRKFLRSLAQQKI